MVETHKQSGGIYGQASRIITTGGNNSICAEAHLLLLPGNSRPRIHIENSALDA